MNVGDLFAQLSFGELSNLSIGMEGAGTIIPAMQPSIVNHANNVLTQIYSRFTHNKYYVNLELVADQTKYFIRPAHAVTALPLDNDVPRYILDTEAEPFVHELIKILDIEEAVDTNEDNETNIHLNDTMDADAIRTLSYDTILVPNPVAGIVLILECQVNHLPLTLTTVDLAEEIVLHPLLQDALVAKVASRVYSGMNGEENAAKASRLNAEYEAACQMVNFEDFAQNSSAAVTKKMAASGWP